MTYSPHPKGTVLLKAKRETLVLLASATALTFAVSYAVHKRPVAVQGGVPVQQQVWAGQLSELPTDAGPVKPGEPMTSASLVVPAADIALPAVQTAQRPVPAVVKAPRACEGTACPVKVSLVSKPVVAPSPAVLPSSGTTAKAEPKESPSLMAKLNPINHLPDAVRHPLDYAGDTVSGWMKRL